MKGTGVGMCLPKEAILVGDQVIHVGGDAAWRKRATVRKEEKGQARGTYRKKYQQDLAINWRG